MKNPLNKRLPRELKSEFGKYLVLFIFLAGMIALVSGFLVADGSMLKAYEQSFEKYNIEDTEILDAIACHTTGKPAMTLLEKIIYISDYIEPMRNKASNLEEVRKMAFVDLDETLFKILSDTLVYLEKSSKKIDPMTMQTYEYYRKQRDSAK